MVQSVAMPSPITTKPPSGRPKLHPLKTPKSASFPSEISSATPLSAVPSFIKQEEGTKTPITPPRAYTDFLKALSPTVGSPGALTASTGNSSSGKSTPTSQPSSAGSGSFISSCSCDKKAPKISIPQSPFSMPLSAPPNANWRMRLPDTPIFSPGSTASPLSARSPHEWDMEKRARYFESIPRTPRTAGATTRPVSVKQVVTRTVTYTPKMDLAPAPKGKKRKLE